jgi:uncharacterized protein
VKLRSSGRGGGYSMWRGLGESIFQRLYAGDWPARLWARVPGSCTVAAERHVFPLPTGHGRACRLAFVSDLHLGPTTSLRVLEAAFALLREYQPDVLVLGGDYVYLDVTPARLSALASLVSSVESQVKVAVLGNHDLWTDDEAIVETLSTAGASVLVNRGLRLPSPWTDVAVVGLDDPWAGDCNADAALATLNGEACRIVVCHSPDGLLQLRDCDFSLFLAGHTHGGQVAAPWGPIVMSRGRLCRQYSGGLASFQGKPVVGSRGVGGIEVPLRTYARPDILLIDLQRHEGAESGGGSPTSG